MIRQGQASQKTGIPGAMFQAIEANVANSICWLSSELSISQSSEVCQLYNINISIQNSQIALHIIKILQNFGLTLEVWIYTYD